MNKRYILVFIMLILFGSITPLIHAEDGSFDVNITKNYTTLTDEYHIIEYLFGGGVLLLFLAIFYINILKPKEIRLEED